MPQRARPTLRCLREDLGQAIPRADTPLDEVPHPLLAKASERFADDSTPQERIASIDDHDDRVRLGGEELPPGRPGPPRRGIDAGRVQDLAGIYRTNRE
jgi:hypothetical protein